MGAASQYSDSRIEAVLSGQFSAVVVGTALPSEDGTFEFEATVPTSERCQGEALFIRLVRRSRVAAVSRGIRATCIGSDHGIHISKLEAGGELTLVPRRRPVSPAADDAERAPTQRTKRRRKPRIRHHLSLPLPSSGSSPPVVEALAGGAGLTLDDVRRLLRAEAIVAQRMADAPEIRAQLLLDPMSAFMEVLDDSEGIDDSTRARFQGVRGELLRGLGRFEVPDGLTIGWRRGKP